MSDRRLPQPAIIVRLRRRPVTVRRRHRTIAQLRLRRAVTTVLHHQDIEMRIVVLGALTLAGLGLAGCGQADFSNPGRSTMQSRPDGSLPAGSSAYSAGPPLSASPSPPLPN